MTNTSEKQIPDETTALAAHILPFVAWLLLSVLLGEGTAWKYALRGVICLALFLAYRPWRWYPRFQVRNLVPALLTGILLFVVWIFFETDFASRWPRVSELYLTVGLMPPWKATVFTATSASSPYSPEVCGWILTTFKIAASAFVISFIEEFFWR